MTGMTLLTRVRGLVRLASEVYRGSPAADTLAAIVARLDEPLRVAIAGRVKAGKSTLLNALVGQELAATDAGECTRIATWYRDGTSYQLTLYPRSGAPCRLPFARSGAATRVELNGFDPQDVDRLVVDWPSAALREMTLIDTPGLGSVNVELSNYTVALLAPEDARPSTADAVIYLMRHLHGLDVRFLEAFHDEPGRRRPFNTIGILARADEIGHGRPDSLDSAARIAARYRGDSRVRQLCQTVIPVSGLLAASGSTLRETEYRALQLIATAPHEAAERLLVSADRFTEPAFELPRHPAGLHLRPAHRGLPHHDPAVVAEPQHRGHARNSLPQLDDLQPSVPQYRSRRVRSSQIHPDHVIGHDKPPAFPVLRHSTSGDPAAPASVNTC